MASIASYRTIRDSSTVHTGADHEPAPESRHIVKGINHVA